MTIIPSAVPLGELVTEEREPIGTYDGSGLPVYGVTNNRGVTSTGVAASEDRSKYLRIRPGRIVYNPYRINVGSVGLAAESQEGICSPAYVVVKANGRICPEYLLFFLKSVRGNQLINFHGNRGSVRGALRFSDLTKIKIPLPPIGDQKSMLDKIGALAEKVENARRLRFAAEVSTSVLYSRLLNAAFDEVRSTTVRVGDIFRVTTGGTPSRSNPAYWGDETKWVSSGEVAFRNITETREHLSALGLENSNAKIYPPGTVLLAMIGQGKTRGQCAVLDCYAATNQNVAAIHVPSTSHVARYVYWWLYANYQKSRASDIGTAQPALSADRVKQMMIPLPTPDQQRKIVAQLDAIDTKIALIKSAQLETAAELDAMLPAILDKAFRNEL